MIKETRERGKTDICAFCREPAPSSEEEDIKRTEKLMDANNAYAFYNLGGFYEHGIRGMPQDWSKANELWLRAGGTWLC